MSIVVENLTVSYQRRPVVHHVDMVFEDSKDVDDFRAERRGQINFAQSHYGFAEDGHGQRAL